MSSIHLPIRQLVEFLLRTGSIDSRFTGFDRALEGARIHRKLQKAAGEDYQAEVFLSAERQTEGLTFLLEGRADGIFTDGSGTTVIDEIKTTAVPYEAITEDMNPCHWAQGMVYGAIYCARQSLPELNVQLTYYQIDTDQIIRFVRHFSAPELEQFLQTSLSVYPMGTAAAGLGGKAQPEPCCFAVSFCAVPPRAAGTGGGSLPRLPRRKGCRPQRRQPSVLSGTHRHRQDHERPLPRPAGHG